MLALPPRRRAILTRGGFGSVPAPPFPGRGAEAAAGESARAAPAAQGAEDRHHRRSQRREIHALQPAPGQEGEAGVELRLFPWVFGTSWLCNALNEFPAGFPCLQEGAHHPLQGLGCHHTRGHAAGESWSSICSSVSREIISHCTKIGLSPDLSLLANVKCLFFLFLDHPGHTWPHKSLKSQKVPALGWGGGCVLPSKS